MMMMINGAISSIIIEIFHVEKKMKKCEIYQMYFNKEDVCV